MTWLSEATHGGSGCSLVSIIVEVGLLFSRIARVVRIIAGGAEGVIIAEIEVIHGRVVGRGNGVVGIRFR